MLNLLIIKGDHIKDQCVLIVLRKYMYVGLDTRGSWPSTISWLYGLLKRVRVVEYFAKNYQKKGARESWTRIPWLEGAEEAELGLPDKRGKRKQD